MINLKKGIALLLLSAATISTYAQSDSSSFDPHWNLRGQVGVGYTVGESSFGNLISPAAALSVGYQFTPVFGLRLGGSGWQAKGRAVTLSESYKFNYIQGNLDASFNFLNIFCDYKSDRLFEPYIFAGVGLNYAFNNDEAVAINAQDYILENLWTDSKTFIAGRAGIGTDIRLSDSFALNVEINGNILGDEFNSKEAPTSDWQFNGLVGFTYKFGANKAAAATALAAEAAAAEAASKAAADKAAADKAAAEKAAADKAAAEKAAADKAARDAAKAAADKAAAEKAARAPRNIFFELNSAEITAEGDAQLSSLAAYMKKNPNSKVVVTGYADADTGSERYNTKLSETRAENATAALIEKGVASDNITTEYKGATVQPFSDNEKNRVVICVLE